MPEISVIVPVFNVEKYLCRCIESILAQTLTDFEIILINDGSSDKSGDLCNEYAKKDSRIKVIHQENGGVSAARNAGLDIANGNYISFVDSDDYIYPQHLEYLYSAICDSDADISVCKMIEFFDTPPILEFGKVNYVKYQGIEICHKLCDYNVASGLITPWGKLYRKHVLNNIRFPQGKIHEDQFVMHKIFYYCKNIVILPEKLYGYFNNTKGITKSGFKINRYDNIEALEEQWKFYIQKDEVILANKIQELSRLICAMFSIYARESEIYKDVPKCYRIGIVNAGRIIRKKLGYDVYEWHMAKVIPISIKIQSFVRKIYFLCVNKNRGINR